MSANIEASARAGRSALQIIAAAVVRLLQRHRSERPLPHDWREIERVRLEYELRKADIAINVRFKIM